MKDPCVVCGEDSAGGRSGFALCRKHWDEVAREDESRAELDRLFKYEQERDRFRREYPGIAFKKRGK